MTIMTREGARTWWKEELPKNVIHMYKDDFGGEWKEYTYAERNAERKKKQDAIIREKRYCHKRVPCFIHVFKLNTDWFFDGWYIMIITIHGKWYLNWKEVYRQHKEFLPRIKQHLNFGLLPFTDDEIWFAEFCKTYPMRPKGIQKPRGKYLTHCVIDSWNNLIEIEI
ncbi:MAG: hypothetical protein FWB73_00195 [Treponema sp.]|nr:hypothetical protein [Treponema sp.]